MVLPVNVHDDIARTLSLQSVVIEHIERIGTPVKLYNEHGFHECVQLWLQSTGYMFVANDELFAAVEAALNPKPPVVPAVPEPVVPAPAPVPTEPGTPAVG